MRPHIVILGAGFGGVYVAKRLARAVKRGEVDVTIVNRTNNFLFTPLLHEVATGGLNPRSVAEPLREIFVGTNMRIIEGEADSIGTAARSISIKEELRSTSLKYDYLVVATGAETNYYGIPGAREHSLPLKSLRDATVIRNAVIEAFEEAVTIENPKERRDALSFFVVGGGATGVEVAAELVEFIDEMVDRYYKNTDCPPDDPKRCKREESTVTLIHADKELLSQFSSPLRAYAHKHLSRKGIKVRLNTAVTSVAKNSITLSSGETLPASIVIWSAGVKAAVPNFEDAKPTLTGGRIAVDSHFRLLGSDRIFAMGDVAAYMDTSGSSNPKPLPQLAQVAESEADIVAMNLLAVIRKEPLRDFRYRSKGSLVSVGQWFALGEIYSMDIAGAFTWWLWRTVYLFKFASWKKRIKIGFEWFLALFFPRDITKVN